MSELKFDLSKITAGEMTDFFAANKEQDYRAMAKTFAQTRVGGRLSDMGKDIAKITAPLIAIGVVGVHTASQFDVAMNEISARTGLVGEDLEEVRQYALQMGADTVFSAQQASERFGQPMEYFDGLPYRAILDIYGDPVTDIHKDVY